MFSLTGLYFSFSYRILLRKKTCRATYSLCFIELYFTYLPMGLMHCNTFSFGGVISVVRVVAAKPLFSRRGISNMHASIIVHPPPKRRFFDYAPLINTWKYLLLFLVTKNLRLR